MKDTADVTGGTFRLYFMGRETEALPFDATIEEVNRAMELAGFHETQEPTPRFKTIIATNVLVDANP
jgi:hypothetical protein